MTEGIVIFGVRGIPEVRRGDDLAQFITTALLKQNTSLKGGDVVVITQKVVSKAEGRVVSLKDIIPSTLALEVAREGDKDPRHVEVIFRESRRIVRMDMGVIIAETRQGFKCANAGVDASNVGQEDAVSLLPENPDLSAQRIRLRIRELTRVDVAVVVSDTFGRPWREGATNVAIGVAGLNPLRDYRGSKDAYGYELQTTVIAVADELAGAAELVTDKVSHIPVAIVRGFNYPKGQGSGRDLVRSRDKDLFP